MSRDSNLGFLSQILLLESREVSRVKKFSQRQSTFITAKIIFGRKHKCFICSPFYVKGVSLGHVGRNENLEDLQDRAYELVVLHMAKWGQTASPL